MRQVLIFIGFVGLALLLFYGGLVWMIQDSKQRSVEDEAAVHAQNIEVMKFSVAEAQARCQVVSNIRPETLRNFNPFAGKNTSESAPDMTYRNNAADLMYMLNEGYLSLKATGSTAFIAIEGNLFPVNGICGNRLNAIAEALSRYAQ